MRKTIKALLVMLCLCLTMTMLACSPVSMSIRYYEGDGVEAHITLQVSELKNLDSTSYARRVDKVYEIITKYKNDLDTAFENRLIELYRQIYPLDELHSRSEKLTYIIARNPWLDKEINVTPSLGEFRYNTSKSIDIECKFISSYAYIMYFYPDAVTLDVEKEKLNLNKDEVSMLTDVPIANSQIETSGNALVLTYIQHATPFSYNGGECQCLSAWTVGTKHFDAGTSLFTICCEALDLDGDEASFAFSFLTPYNRLRSSGTLSKQGNLYVHTWTFDDMTTQVTLYRNVAKQFGWYLIIAIIGVLLIGGGLTIIYFVNKHKKKKGLAYMKKINAFVENERKSSYKAEQKDDNQDEIIEIEDIEDERDGEEKE